MGMKPLCRNCHHEHWSHEPHTWPPEVLEQRKKDVRAKAAVRVSAAKVAPVAAAQGASPDAPPTAHQQALRDDSGAAGVSADGKASGRASLGKMKTTRDRAKFNAYMRAYRQKKKLETPKP